MDESGLELRLIHIVLAVVGFLLPIAGLWFKVSSDRRRDQASRLQRQTEIERWRTNVERDIQDLRNQGERHADRMNRHTSADEKMEKEITGIHRCLTEIRVAMIHLAQERGGSLPPELQPLRTPSGR